MNTKRNRTHEEEYFFKREVMIRAMLKHIDKIKKIGIKDELLAKKLVDAHFNQDSMRVIFFVPLVETAWADDEIHDDEYEEILNILSRRGIHPDSETYRIVLNWLEMPPVDKMFTSAKELFAPMVAEFKNTSGEKPDWIIESAKQVANAAGSALSKIGLWGKTSFKEGQVIEKFAVQMPP